jgi:hypothetical protein
MQVAVDMRLMQWMGANAFRSSHYPYDPLWYEQADSRGMLIIDECPAVGLGKGEYFNAGAGPSVGGCSFWGQRAAGGLLSSVQVIGIRILQKEGHLLHDCDMKQMLPWKVEVHAVVHVTKRNE